MLLDCGKSLYFRLSSGFSILLTLLACSTLVFTGCGGKKRIPPTAKLKSHGDATVDETHGEDGGSEAPAAATIAAYDPASLGTISGKVVLKGEPEANLEIGMGGDATCANHPTHAGKTVYGDRIIVSDSGAVKNAVVFLQKAPDGAPARTETVKIDQVGCMYTPHVVGLQAGQSLAVTSSDGTTHNVNGRPIKNTGFNFAQSKGDLKELNFAKKETFSIKCDIHSWMQAWIAVFDHPFFAVTDENGNFEIKGVPAGEYEVRAWHEFYGNPSTKTKVLKQPGVKVETDKTTSLTFTFKPKK